MTSIGVELPGGTPGLPQISLPSMGITSTGTTSAPAGAGGAPVDLSDDDISGAVASAKPVMTIGIGTKNTPKPASTDLSDDDIAGAIGAHPAAKAQKEAVTAANKAPPGAMSEDDAIKTFNDPATGKPYDPAEIKSSSLYSQGMFQDAFAKPNDFLQSVESGPIGPIIKGIQNDIVAPAQLGVHATTALGLTTPADAKLIDLSAKIAQNNYDQNWRGRVPTATNPNPQQPLAEQIEEGVGSALVPIPGLAEVGPAATTAGKIAQAAVVGGVMAPLTSPVTNNSSQPFVQQKIMQGAYGAAGGGVLGAVGQAGIKVANAVGQQYAPATKALIDTAKKYGAYKFMSAADISGSAIGHRVMGALQNVPDAIGGTGGFAGRLKGAAKDVADKYSADLHDQWINARYDGMAAVDRAAAGKGLRAEAAKALQARMAAKPDLAEGLRTSADSVSFRKHLVSDKLYNKMRSLAGKMNVKTTNVNKAIDKSVAELNTISGPSKHAPIQYLEFIKSDLASAGQPKDYQSIRNTVTAMERNIADLEGGANPNSTLVGHLKSVVAGFNNDLRQFENDARRKGLRQAADRADTYYKENILPERAKSLARYYDDSVDAQPNKIVGELSAAGVDNAQKAYNALDTRGRDMAKYGLFMNAVEAATAKSTKLQPTPTVSAKILSESLGEQEKAVGVFFKGNDKFEIDGMQNLLNHMQTHADHGHTGFLLALLVEHGSSVGAGLEKAAELATAAFQARWLMTSEPGKRLLLSAASLAPGSPAMSRLLDKIQLQIPGVAANVEGNRTDRAARVIR